MWNESYEMSKRQKRVLYLGAFMIPAVMMLFVMAALGIYPFGNRSILVSDLQIQFVDYYSYFKTVLAGRNDLIYTFSKNLGGDMVGFSAYYLQNPLLLVLLFFPDRLLPVGITLMIMLQISFSGLSFCWFLNQTYRPRFSSLLFSTAYAFLGFFFSYISLPIYFSNLIILPIVVLGIIRIVQDYRDWKLYTISLAVYIFMNYYLGFMMCIFSALFFVYMVLIRIEKIKDVWKCVKNFAVYMVSSAAAVLLIAFDLVMTAYSLKGQKEGLSLKNLSFYRQFRILDFFSKFYTGSDKNHELPIVYCSVLAVLFLILYFICRKYTKREKLYSAGFLALLILCFNIHTLNVIWHGFNDPVGFAYRYAYFFSFLVLFLGYRGFTGLNYRLEKKQLVVIAVIFFGYSAYLLLRKNGYVGGKDILLNGLILFAEAGLYFAVCNFKEKKSVFVLFLLLFIIQAADLTSNAVRAVHFYPENEMSTYTEEVTQVGDLIRQIKESDSSLYRLEKDFQKDVNDSMMYNYAGLSHSSSCEKDYVKEFIGKMGFRNNNLWAYYHKGSTTFADCFLGVKYFVSRFDSTEKPYVPLFDKYGYYVYENPYALPFGFCVSEDMMKVSADTDNSFVFQNETAKAFGTSEDIYDKAEADISELVNLKQEKNGAVTTYMKENPEQEAYLEYKVTVKQNAPLYVFFSAPDTQSAELIVNGDSYDNYFTQTDWSILNIGTYASGEAVTVRLRLNEDRLCITDEMFYQENQEALKNWFQAGRAGAASLERISSSHLKGQVAVPEGKNLLMFSIPFEEDWKIKIDGKTVKQQEVLGALLAVQVPSGTHTIDMQYVPRGFFPTIAISIITAVILMFIMINDKIKNTGYNRLERNYL